MIAKIGVGVAIAYFLMMGMVFVFNPLAVEGFGLQWINPAGKTEVRCYYGALSWALAASLTYLLVNGLAKEAVTVILFLASAVLIARVLGTAVDGAWDEAYTKSAIPIEIVFVVTALIVWWTATPSARVSDG
jgi:hypothetical protein